MRSSPLMFLFGMVCGAALMMLLDPISGRRRRKLVADKLVKANHSANWYAHRKARHLRNKAHGWYVTHVNKAHVSDNPSMGESVARI